MEGTSAVAIVAGHVDTAAACRKLLVPRHWPVWLEIGCIQLLVLAAHPHRGHVRRMDSAVFEYEVLRARLGYAAAMFEGPVARDREIPEARRHDLVRGRPGHARQGIVFAPFFGIPASTITATHHLARLSGAAVLPFFHRRTADAGYVLRVEAPLDDFPRDDVVAGTARINAAIERMAREAPA